MGEVEVGGGRDAGHCLVCASLQMDSSLVEALCLSGRQGGLGWTFYITARRAGGRAGRQAKAGREAEVAQDTHRGPGR